MSDPATEAALREMSRSIGGLESTVKTLVSTWQSQEVSATQGRRDLYQKFDAMASQVFELKTKLESALSDITELKPSVAAFESAKQQAAGAQKVGKWIWGFLTLGGGSIGWMLANWVTLGPKPPLH